MSTSTSTVHGPPPVDGGSQSPTIVGIGEKVISRDPAQQLITFSLGSCVGVVLAAPHLPAAGLIHCLLPMSKLDEKRAADNPDLFADTGVSGLLEAMFRMGCDRSQIIAYLAGGSSVMDDKGFFKIGERNVAVSRKVLEKNSITIKNESVGGTDARTMSVNVATGEVRIRIGREEITL